MRADLRALKVEASELIAIHTGEAQDFTKYADDPVGFIRDVLGAEPWSRQEEIAQAVLTDALLVVRSAHAVGKDWLAARLSLWWVYACRGLAIITGPTERQVREIVMGEVARAWGPSKLPGELYATSLRLGREETAGILAFTSKDASRLTGFHAPRVMGIITEAQGVEDFTWESMLSCATGSEDRILAVGNPMSPSGRFYTASKSKAWTALQISAEEHPNFETDNAIPGGPSRAFAERIASEYGRHSGIYRSRVLGDFPEEAEEGLFTRSWIDAAEARWSDENGGPVIVAVDPARYGPDATCVCVLRGSQVEELREWRKEDLTESAVRVDAILTEYEASEVVVDVVGIGAGLADRLREAGHNVTEFNGGAGAGDRFLNRRASAFWTLREELEAGRLALPKDDALVDELLAVRWRPTPEGRIRIEEKAVIRSLLGKSPDRADAVSMAVWAASREVDLDMSGLHEVNASLWRPSPFRVR